MDVMNKQLVIILKTFPKLSETFILQEIIQLVRCGINPIIYSRAYPVDEPFTQSAINGVNLDVRYIPYATRDKDDSLYKVIWRLRKKYGLRTMIQMYREAKNRGKGQKKNKSRLCAYAALWILDNLNPEDPHSYHIHTQFLDYPTEIAYNIHRLSGIEYSISCHAKDIYTSPEVNIKEYIKNAVAVKTCTKYNANYLSELAGGGEKIHTVYHGINCNFFSRDAIDNHLRLISVARLVEKKGYFTILKALNMLKSRYPNFIYTIIGHGDLQQEILKQISFLHLENHVIIIPYALQEVIRDYLRHSDIFINASIITKSGDRDGIPNSIAEAMAMGVPVVATDVSGISELVHHKETGYLAQTRDASSIYNGLVYYIENPNERERIARNGCKYVRDNFNKDKMFSQCKQFYSELLGYNC